MKNLVFGAAALLLLSACGQESQTDAGAEAEADAEPKALVSGLDLDAMDTSVKPGDDLFRYMNGTWLRESEIPADRASYGGFTVLRDESQENVKTIIEESANGDFATGTDEQKVGDLYKSYLDMETRNALGIKPLQPEFDVIDEISSYDALIAFFARASRYGVSVPLDLEQLVDWNDPTRYSMIITQGGLGLPDREYYLLEDEKSETIRQKYVEHLETTFDLAGLPSGSDSAAAIMALETRLAEKNMTKEQGRQRAENYAAVASADLDKIMPQMNWDAYFSEFGMPELDSVVMYG
ncbi:MAG: M13 family metallopeptidase N-terminal domain-containing protein, partial [Thermodesulfobacteriota bacterium]